MVDTQLFNKQGLKEERKGKKTQTPGCNYQMRMLFINVEVCICAPNGLYQTVTGDSE